MFQDNHPSLDIKSLMKSIYQNGILPKAGCAVLQCEGSDEKIVKGLKSADGSLKFRNMLMSHREWSVPL